MNRRGVLRVAAALAAPGTVALGGMLFSRALPAASRSPSAAVQLPYFGHHFHRLVPIAGKFDRPTVWVGGSIGSLRLWDSGTRWGDVAPRPGVWNFERMDAYVGAAERQGASLLYTLGSTPRWASARPDEPGPYGPGCAAEPVRLAHWEEYVARIAHRYRGRIQAYELWNEPHFSDYARDRQHPGFFTGSVAQMVDLARVARQVLDRVDPAALLTTPGFVNGPHRLDLFLASGGAALVQVVAYHFYAPDSIRFAQQVVEVREVMRKHQLQALPLWNTECGVETFAENEALPEGVTQRLTEAQAAERAAQFVLLGAALRLDKFFYYAWDNHRSGLVDSNGRYNPRFEALQRVQRWLLGAEVSAAEWSGTSVFIRGETEGAPFVLAWSESARLEVMRVPAGWKIVSCEAVLDAGAARCARATSPGQRVALSAAPQRLGLGRA